MKEMSQEEMESILNKVKKTQQRDFYFFIILCSVLSVIGVLTYLYGI